MLLWLFCTVLHDRTTMNFGCNLGVHGYFQHTEHYSHAAGILVHQTHAMLCTGTGNTLVRHLILRATCVSRRQANLLHMAYASILLHLAKVWQRFHMHAQRYGEQQVCNSRCATAGEIVEMAAGWYAVPRASAAAIGCSKTGKCVVPF